MCMCSVCWVETDSSYDARYIVFKQHSRYFIPLPFIANVYTRAALKRVLKELCGSKREEATGAYSMYGEEERCIRGFGGEI